MRLFPLTRERAKPSVPIAGKFRLIDIPLSNCIHSDLREVYILTQFNSASLIRHVSETYHFGAVASHSVRILAAAQTPSNMDWYQGTADAVRQNLCHIIDSPGYPEHILVLAGDHLYRMDYREIIASHCQRNAAITVGVIPVGREQTQRFGILRTDSDGRIEAFAEKPQSDAQVDSLISDPSALRDQLPDIGDAPFLASMGIYVFRADVLVEAVSDSSNIDFGQHIIPKSIHSCDVFAHPFAGYWEDIGTIRSYYDANLALLDTVPRFNFYDESAPIFTYGYHLPGTKVNESYIRGSMLAEGSIIDRSEIVRSIIGLRCTVGADTRIENSILLGANYYESAAQIAANRARGQPPMGIGQRCHIRGAIIDKGAHVGDDVVLTNQEGVAEAESDGWYIRDHIIIVPCNGVIPPGTVV
jgi:glucose-1-phosphate adenylyltransferase